MRHTSGWPETHSSMCTESILQPPIQMPPHSRHSHIFKRAFAHLMMHDSFFSSIHADWLCVGGCAGWMELCVRVAETRWSRIGGQRRVTVWNCYWQANGSVWAGVRVQGTETNKEWSCWRLMRSCTRKSSILIEKGSVRSRQGRTDRQTDTLRQTRGTIQIITIKLANESVQWHNTGIETIVLLMCLVMLLK